MIINYLNESGPFGSYKKRNTESVRKTVAKDLEHAAKTAILNKLSVKIGELIKEHVDKHEDLYINFKMSGLAIIGKNGDKKSEYTYWNEINGNRKNLEEVMPVFRLDLENNTIVVIMSCIPLGNYKIAIQGDMNWYDWMKSLKRFLNYNIDRITEDGSSFNYEFDVKLEIDPDILDEDGRVNVSFTVIRFTYNINQIQDFVDHFYKQFIRIKTHDLSFSKSMTSNEMYKQYIERFQNLIKTTDAISLDMFAMKEFDLENLNIISVLVDPYSDVEVRYELKIKETGASLKGIEKFVRNEYNMSFEELKELAYQKRANNLSNLRNPENLKVIYLSYNYNNPKDLQIKGVL